MKLDDSWVWISPKEKAEKVGNVEATVYFCGVIVVMVVLCLGGIFLYRFFASPNIPTPHSFYENQLTRDRVEVDATIKVTADVVLVLGPTDDSLMVMLHYFAPLSSRDYIVSNGSPKVGFVPLTQFYHYYKEIK